MNAAIQEIFEEAESQNVAQWKAYRINRSIELRNELVLQYTGVVRKIVLRFRGSYNNFGQLDDMVNQGIIALIDAVEKYDIEMGNKFETFASIKIRGSIIDFMRKQDWVPRNQRSLAKELDEVFEKLYCEYGREPAQAEIAQQMDISVENLEKVMGQRHNSILLSYEEVVFESVQKATPIGTRESDENSPEDELLYSELRSKLGEAIDELNERERQVVSLYYYESLKLKEIATILGISESRVSQIHSAAIMKMKYKLSNY
ncbi:MAG: FliA/WhiG family RNA polymerase sigma factor [Eubacteriales bacterium]